MFYWLILVFVLNSCQSTGPAHKEHNEKKAPIRVMIDTDPALGIIRKGRPQDVDDGLAIVEALNSPHIEVRLVTTVFGNSEVNDGTRIAKDLVSLTKTPVAVARGCQKAGLLKKERLPQAVFKMAEQLRESKLTVIALGPLTNIANLIEHFPNEAKNIERIIAVMGRSPGQQFYIGDFGPVRDFNYVKDPISAQKVVESGIPLALTPFELSKSIVITAEDLIQLNEKKTPASFYLYTKSQAWLEFWTNHFPNETGFHPWDSAAVGYVLNRSNYKCESRFYRFRKVRDSAHGVGVGKTGKKKEKQPWFELGKDFPQTHTIDYCFEFFPDRKDRFRAEMFSNLY